MYCPPLTLVATVSLSWVAAVRGCCNTAQEWIENYLTTNNKTCMIVSHDSQFLNNVCTHIIHYEELKLKVRQPCLRQDKTIV